MVNCSVCGKVADPNLDNCPHCGAPVRASMPRSGAVSKEPPHQCPNCDTPVQDGDIICVRCGTNLLTGHKIVEERAASVETEGGNLRPWFIFGGLAVFVVAAVGLLVLLSHDPVKEAVRLFRQDDVLGAITVLQRHVESHEDDVEAQITLGKLHFRNRNFAGAADAFETAMEHEPWNSEAGKLAIMALGEMPGDMGRNRLLAAVRGLVDNHPDDAQARFLLALALGSIDNHVGQIEQLQELVARGATEMPAHQHLGIAHAIEGEYDKASDELRRTALVPAGGGRAGDVPAARGLLANLDGRGQDAMGYLEEALAQGTSIERETKTRLGLLHMANGNFEEAKRFLDNARDDDPAHEATRFYQALCRQALKLNPEALAEFESLVEKEGPYAAAAALQAAILHMEMGDLPGARAAAQRAAQLGQPSARSHTVQGQIEVMAGDQAAAQTQFRKAIALDPDYPAAHLENGLLYVNRGVVLEGLRELESYLSLIGSEAPGTRRAEIELLVSQLKRTVRDTTRPGRRYGQ